MRCVAIVVLAACGRIDFDVRSGAGDASDASDAITMSGASQLVAYGHHTCAIVGGAAYCWGDNSLGALGANGVATLLVPTRVPITGTITAIALGEAHACFDSGGDLSCAGDSSVATVALAAPITAVAGGRGFTCAVADTMYCWGANGAGQLGVGDIGVHTQPTPVLVSPSATLLGVGDDHACTVVADKAQCWGHNDNGTLGTGSTLPDHQPSPVSVMSIATLPHIAGWHACALANGMVSCWGRGDHGEMGNNMTTLDNPVPEVITSLQNVTALATGGGPADFDASCAIVPPDVYCWGTGMYGRLGQGTAANSSVPVKVMNLPADPIDLALGYDHTCARYATGDVWCWGRGDRGQLGDGMGATSMTPVKVALP